MLLVVALIVVESASVRYDIILVVDVILSIFWFLCLSLIAYFYVKAYLAVRKWNRTRICPVNVLVKGKLENKFAYTTFWLTVFFAVSGFPTVTVYLFRETWPFFRQGWAETILQLNSLFNPLLYWYRTRRLRKQALEMLRCRCSVKSLDVEKFQSEQRRPRILRSKSLEAVMCSDTFGQRSSKSVKETPTSVARDEKLTQQRDQLIVTVQIENAPGRERQSGRQKHTTDLGGSWRHIGFKRIVRSSSLYENSLTVSLTKHHHNATERNAQRSRSVPIILTNLIHEPKDRTTASLNPCSVSSTILLAAGIDRVDRLSTLLFFSLFLEEYRCSHILRYG